MNQLMDKKSLFLNQDSSDFVINIESEKLYVHKTVLMSSSEYFSALFNSEMIETKTKEISLKETLIKPFIIVLKVTYDRDITQEEWREMKIQELFEAIIIANKYQFIECEKFLSRKLIEIFSFKITDTVDEVVNSDYCKDRSLLTIWELLEMAKLHNLMFLIDLCLVFFDENISYAFKTFDKQFISADILLDVIKRDTFGAHEIDIFNIVQKWILKNRIRYNLNCIEETLLLGCVRLTLMSLEQLTSSVIKSGLYESETIDHVIKHELNGELAQNHRVCYESGRLFTEFSKNETHLRNEENSTVCVTCLLPMPTKVNHLMFIIRQLSCDENNLKFNSNYWIGIPDSNAENGFRQIVDYKQYSCLGKQELFFDEPFVTNNIRICLEYNIDGDVVIDPPNRRSFRDQIRVTIHSLSYEYTKSPLKMIDNCLVPELDFCKTIGVNCYSPYFGDQFNEHLNDIVLNKTNKYSDYYDSCRHKKGVSITTQFKQRMHSPVVDFGQHISDFGLNLPPFYLIRLSQPIFVDCLQFEINLDETQRIEEIVSAECKVEFCSAYIRDISSAKWMTISDESYLTNTGYYNLEFDLQKILVIRISGFRFNSDRSVRFPLYIKNFSIPADRNSWDWSSGQKLGNN